VIHPTAPQINGIAPFWLRKTSKSFKDFLPAIGCAGNHSLTKHFSVFQTLIRDPEIDGSNQFTPSISGLLESPCVENRWANVVAQLRDSKSVVFPGKRHTIKHLGVQPLGLFTEGLLVRM